MSKTPNAEADNPDEPIKIGTIPFDPRFPQANQTLNCFTHYTDYFRCMDALKGDEVCEYFKKVFTTLCPLAWVTRWDELRETGNFPGRLVRVPSDYCIHKKPSKDECEK